MTSTNLGSVTALLGSAVRIATHRLAEGARNNARTEIEARAALSRDYEATAAALRRPPILDNHGPQGRTG